MTHSPGGKLVIGLGRKIYRYLRSGHPDLSFGQHGRITIEVPADTQFEPAGLAVDRLGRVVLAGTSRLRGAAGDPGPTQFGGPPPTRATVIRYLPSGSPDLGFGTEGRVDTTLGLSPPAPHLDYSDPSRNAVYKTPAVSVGAVTVDRLGRPVIAGASVSEVSLCYPGVTHYVKQAYVSRLTDGGALDTSFSGTGIASSHLGSSLAPAPSGNLLVVGWAGVECPRGDPLNQPSNIYRLTPDGGIDPGFGSGGVTTVRYDGGPEVVVDSQHRILLAGNAEFPENDSASVEGKLGKVLTCLRPNGTVDPTFGHRGLAPVNLRKNSWLDALAVDDRGRPLLVGWAARKTARHSWEFQLLRLTTSGRIDRSFGAQGFARTRFGARSNGSAEAVMVSAKGRIVVGGTISSPRFPSGSGIALVRYQDGS
jgi:uncharacterized delta-60 repeat protein